MKLVFVASLAGKESLNQSYKKIVSICRDLNHEVFDDYVTQHTQDALEKASAFLMSTKNISPNLKKFIVLRSMVNVTHRFLASDLDKPQAPGIPEVS